LCAAASSGLSLSPPRIPWLSIVTGAGSGGDAGQLTRSPGSSCAFLAHVVTVDSALALAQPLQPSLAFLARDSMLSALSQIRPSVCLSVRPSVTRVDQSKTVEDRIMQFSPYSSTIPLMFYASAAASWRGCVYVLQ